MARRDAQLDAMLRHLGAAYYESRHGRAARSDVTRALDTVEEHLNEPAQARPKPGPHPRHHDDGPRRLRWARRVSDVMTTSVVTVDRPTPYQEIDRLLAEHRISGVPVLRMGRVVAGVVTETDLLAAEDEPARRARMASSVGQHRPFRGQPLTSLTAGTLMTAPPITISPDATIPAAARVMNTHHVKMLPVVDEEAKLIGVVSRRDLLSVFLRPDADIDHDIREVLDEVPLPDPGAVGVSVRHGVVTLTGTADRHQDPVSLAIRLIWDIDGVVDVIRKPAESGKPEEAHARPVRTA